MFRLLYNQDFPKVYLAMQSNQFLNRHKKKYQIPLSMEVKQIVDFD
jgi:hypothetical protein